MGYLIYIIIGLLSAAVVGLSFALTSLQRKVALLESQSKNSSSSSNEAQLKGFDQRLLEQAKGISEGSEKNERELNTLWAELENIRAEMLARIDQGITSTRWQQLLAGRIKDFAQIRADLTTILNSNPELARQLRDNLPAYLFDDDLMNGMLDYSRLPFERINWLEQLILPVSIYLDNQRQQQYQGQTTNKDQPVEQAFNRLLASIGYQSILPNNGEQYRPDYHEVVEQRLSNSPRGTILATRSRGYHQQGSILRKAKVIISQ